MGRIPEATIQEVRDRADIVGLIGRYVELKQAGRNWKGLCPFHEEKSPSFNVNPDRQYFHCFGCEAGGDVVSFLMKYENLTFPESIRSIAGELGIEIPETGSEDRSETEGLYTALELAQKVYRAGLRSSDGEIGRRYLADRSLDEETIERFGLGFVPDRWDTVARAVNDAGIKSAVAELAGILIKSDRGSYYDRLRGRVTFPIHDVRGRVVAFGGRALLPDQEPKYLNTPETPIFRKRHTFYGFPQALEPIRRSERAVVCEGYFDAIALHRAGVGEALATCGTALTPDHAKQLRRRTANVSLLFDGDTAGQKAMERALEVLLPAGLRVKAVILPNGMDPDDHLREHGAEALREVIDRAPGALDAVMRRALAAGHATPAEKADVVRHVAPLIAGVADGVERSEYARRLAMASGADERAVESMVRDSGRGQGLSVQQAVETTPVRVRTQTPEDRHLRQLALILSRWPGLATADLYDRMQEVLPDGVWKRLVTRLLDAAEEGYVAADGALDFIAAEPWLGERLGAEELALFRDIIVNDELLHGERAPEQVLEDVLDRFEDKHHKRTAQELSRSAKLDPQQDALAWAKERQALLDRKRRAVGSGAGSGTTAR